jgi:NADP-dependent 3-hydroxy acid dehydrogenase YdfG
LLVAKDIDSTHRTGSEPKFVIALRSHHAVMAALSWTAAGDLRDPSECAPCRVACRSRPPRFLPAEEMASLLTTTPLHHASHGSSQRHWLVPSSGRSSLPNFRPAANYQASAHPHADRVYIITGGGGGIGSATATILAKEGARLALLDFGEAGLAAAKQEVESFGGQVITMRVDVTKLEQLEDAVEKTVSHFGRLDGLLCGAGVLARKPTVVADLDMVEFERVMAINVTGVTLTMKAAMKHLKYGASIVNIASAAGLIGQPLGYAYSASKHAVIGLSKVAARDYGTK